MEESSVKESTTRIVILLELLNPAFRPEAILAAAWSLGGGGRGDLIFSVPPGGGDFTVLRL